MGTYRLTHPIFTTGRKLVVVSEEVAVPLAEQVSRLSLALGFVPLAAAALAALFMAGASVAAVTEQRAWERYKADVAQVEVRAPQSLPAQSQESVDIAAELFSIAIPSKVSGPFFDPLLEDRGLTTGGTLSAEKNVTIGPAAFTSWSVLGSTLGHEIEVHVQQSFLKVVLLDKLTHAKLEARKAVGRVFPSLKPSARQLFDQGTWSAEREAYLFEFNSAKRFQLSEEEMHSILQVMNYYYPSQDGIPLSVDSTHLSAIAK